MSDDQTEPVPVEQEILLAAQAPPSRPSLGARLTLIVIGLVVAAYLITIAATLASGR